MDKISKALSKLSFQEQKNVKSILLKLNENNLTGLDVKKLKGHNNIFRIRKGKTRIIYKIENGENIKILAIERRSDNTYNFL